jgi:hypothetical protein
MDCDCQESVHGPLCSSLVFGGACDCAEAKS